MAEYFLPDLNILRALEFPYEIRVLTQEDFVDLYLPEWSNALCKDRRHLDVLGVGDPVDGGEARETIASRAEMFEVASLRLGVAGDVHDA